MHLRMLKVLTRQTVQGDVGGDLVQGAGIALSFQVAGSGLHTVIRELGAFSVALDLEESGAVVEAGVGDLPRRLFRRRPRRRRSRINPINRTPQVIGQLA